MTPNATVSYMTAQLEHQLLEAKAARARMVDEAVRSRRPVSGLIRLPLRLRAMLASRIDGRHRTVTTAQSRPHAALGATDPAR